MHTTTTDYRDSMVGNWAGTDTVTLTNWTGGTFTPYSVTAQIVKNGTDGLTIHGFECDLTAGATNASEWVADNGISCTVTTDACDFTFNYDGANTYGQLSGDGSTMTYHGEGTYSADCDDGTDDGDFTEDAPLN